MRKSLIGMSAAAALLAVSGVAHADSVTTVNGSLWENVPAAAQDTSTFVPSGTPSAVFTSTNANLTFDSRVGSNNSANYTIGSWLGTTSGLSILYSSAGVPADTIDNTFMKITGMIGVLSGETFSFTHDDGMFLVIDGVTVTGFTDTATAPVVQTGTYSGPSGYFAYSLAYNECCGAPAVLTGNLTSVPEPSTWAMMILGFFGVGFMAYRRKNNGMSFRVA